MELNTNRIFNHRIVFDEKISSKLKVTNSVVIWLKRIISFIYSPKQFTSENRKTIQAFQKYLINSLGEPLLARICDRYSIDFESMYKKGSSLTSRIVSKIVIGSKILYISDLNEGGEKLSKEEFNKKYDERLMALNPEWKVPKISKNILGNPSEIYSWWFFEPFLADRERLQLAEHFPTDNFETFLHDACARYIKRELDVGMVIPAPNDPKTGEREYYYVAGKRITGKGLVSYILHPTTKDSSLEPVQLFRGTSPRNGEIDGGSTMVTDLEKDLGKTAYLSGNLYEKDIHAHLTLPKIEAGHSLGSNIIQWRLANLDHIETAYLFNGPGVSYSEVEKFNKKNPKVKLVIRQSMKDKVAHFGSVHLGYKAPENVEIDYRRYKNASPNIHISFIGRDKKQYAMEGGIPKEKMDLYFDNRKRVKERIRSLIGPLFSRIIYNLQSWMRRFFSTRTLKQQGLKICSSGKGSWNLIHIRPWVYNTRQL